MKKSILISGEYQAYTGFSCVVENIGKIFADDFDVTIIDYSKNHGYVYRIDNMVVAGKLFDGNTDGDKFGVKKIISVMEKYDFLLLINDIWNIDEMLTEIRLSGKKIPKVIVYFPIDAESHSAHWYKNMDIVSSVVTYTIYGSWVVEEAIHNRFTGFQKQEHRNSLMDKLEIIPHGINQKEFFPIKEKSMVREALFNTKEYNNSYIVLNANRNQPRKRLDLTIMAFNQFVKNNPTIDARLYLHSAIVDCHINTYELCKRLGILDRLILSTSPDSPSQKPSMTTEQINLIYNACDVGINTSIGEGWGLCSFEHAFVGGVQIVPEHSACKEIYTSNESEFIAIEGKVIQDKLMTMASVPSVHNAAAKIEKLLNHKLRITKREKSIERFQSNKYLWNGEIAIKWKKLIAKISQEKN